MEKYKFNFLINDEKRTYIIEANSEREATIKSTKQFEAEINQQEVKYGPFRVMRFTKGYALEIDIKAYCV